MSSIYSSDCTAELDIWLFGRRGDKPLTDDFASIDVRHMARQYRLTDGAILSGNVMVDLEWRRCHFGGSRVYFRCPRCEGRCCILYRLPAAEKPSDRYGCKKCLNMAHPVENEGKGERAVRRYHKAVNRRNYDPARPDGKPLWMRRPTWKRLSVQVTEAAMERFEYDEKMTARLRKLYAPKPSRK